MRSATKSSNFKTASWRGVVHPDRSPATDLVTTSIRLPKELADDVEVAVAKYADWFESKEEFLATAAAFTIQSMTEDPPPIRRPKRPPPHTSRKARSNKKRPTNTRA
jgi:hypothetical protein